MNKEWTVSAQGKWDEMAEHWADNSRNMWESGSRKEIIPFLETYLPPEIELADLGCGDGYGSWKLAKQGYKVTGIDFSKDMIELAKEKAMDPEISELNFLAGNLMELPFEANMFDAALAVNSLEWTEVPVRALAEMERIVKPGGFICIGLLGPTAAPRMHAFRRLFGDKVIMNTMQAWELKKLADTMGWKLKGEKGVPKRGMNFAELGHFSEELKMAVSFMWLFVFQTALDRS
ncbi:class I SAM-dependent methyltransferase [Bacillus massiliglaciei]|uniref:class I SAM-dependent methyltransferase n=1 Tax=Bacillus massiliglaciei TaxID=1816693 RepID=UPI000DA613C0|nr:class I SAM-dependent methyltransferase [Bacillus massiliglaciei]